MKKERFEKAEGEYDFDNDVFSALPAKREYDSSLQIGNLIFDLDSNGKVNGIEILNASSIFGIPKVFLNSIVSGKIEIEVNKRIIKVRISIKSLVRNAHKTSTINVERLKPELIAPAELKLALASS